jgi:hypothetical protein
VAAGADVALRDFDAKIAAKHAELTALLAPGVLPIPSFPAAPPNAVHGVALAAPQGTRGEAAAPTQAVRGVTPAAPPRSVLSGAAASSVASHPISTSQVAAVFAFPGKTYGVKATNEAEAAAPDQGARGVTPAPPTCSVLSGAVASFLPSQHISPYPVSAVSTKLSYATPGQTDGVKTTNEAEAAAPL